MWEWLIIYLVIFVCAVLVMRYFVNKIRKSKSSTGLCCGISCNNCLLYQSTVNKESNSQDDS